MNSLNWLHYVLIVLVVLLSFIVWVLWNFGGEWEFQSEDPNNPTWMVQNCDRCRKDFMYKKGDNFLICPHCCPPRPVEVDMSMETYKAWMKVKERKGQPGYPTKAVCPRCGHQVFQGLQSSVGIEERGYYYFCKNCPYEEFVK